MTSRDFCFWLNGLFELGDPKELDSKQTELVKKHPALVFLHEIDPSMGDNKHQKELNKVHSPTEEEINTLKTQIKNLQNIIKAQHLGIYDRDKTLIRC